MVDANYTDRDLKENVQSAMFNAFKTALGSDEMVVQNHVNDKTHRGQSYTASHEFTGVANGASRSIYVDIPADVEVNIRTLTWTPGSGGLRIEVFENPTVDVAGSPLDADVSLNRQDQSSHMLTIEQGTTFTDDGTLLKNAGTPGTNRAAVVSGGDGAEFILDDSQDYHFKVTNITASSIDNIWFDTFWYED